MTHFRTMKDGREILSKTALGRAEYKRRTLEMAERQGWRCGFCGLAMTPDTVTFDHQGGRGLGGSRREDRIVVDKRRVNAAVHYACNGEVGSRRVEYVVQ